MSMRPIHQPNPSHLRHLQVQVRERAPDHRHICSRVTTGLTKDTLYHSVSTLQLLQFTSPSASAAPAPRTAFTPSARFSPCLSLPVQGILHSTLRRAQARSAALSITSYSTIRPHQVLAPSHVPQQQRVPVPTQFACPWLSTEFLAQLSGSRSQ